MSLDISAGRTSFLIISDSGRTLVLHVGPVNPGGQWRRQRSAAQRAFGQSFGHSSSPSFSTSSIPSPPMRKEALKLVVGGESTKMMLRWPEVAISCRVDRVEWPQRDEIRWPASPGEAMEGGRPSYTKRLFLLQSMSFPACSLNLIVSGTDFFAGPIWEDITQRHSTSPPVPVLLRPREPKKQEEQEERVWQGVGHADGTVTAPGTRPRLRHLDSSTSHSQVGSSAQSWQ